MHELWVPGAVKTMGDVLATFRIMPEGIEVDLAKLKKAISESLDGSAKIEGMEEKPFAFGLKSIDIAVILGDVEGGTEKIEDVLRGLEGVQSVENTGLTLV